MPQGTASALTSFQIGRPVDRTDILVLTLQYGGRELPLALDRRIADALSKGLADIAAKLTAPRHEH